MLAISPSPKAGLNAGFLSGRTEPRQADELAYESLLGRIKNPESRCHHSDDSYFPGNLTLRLLKVYK